MDIKFKWFKSIIRILKNMKEYFNFRVFSACLEINCPKPIVFYKSF